MTRRTRETAPIRDAGISTRTAARLAWSLWAMCVGLMSLAFLLEFFTYDASPLTNVDELIPAFAVPIGVLSLGYPTIGAVIISRLPKNPIGWIFCGVGLLYGIRRLTAAYYEYTLYGNVALPWGEYAGFLSSLLDTAGQALAGVLLMLLFPDGRLPARRWRFVAWAAVCGAALAVLCDAFAPGENPPFEVVGVIGGVLTTYELFAALYCLGMTLLLASTIAALFSLIFRLRRARGDERQQLKWFLYAAAPAAIGLSAFIFDGIVARFTSNFLLDTTHVLSLAPMAVLPIAAVNVRFISIFALLMLPIFTYIAILRYRLYDIDFLINRTLLYGALSSCVVGIYVLAVVGFGVLFQARGNPAISLVATVVVAVLFQPLRGRLQRGVNRLMYGERDDPYAVTSRFGRRLEATLAPEAVLPTVVETIAQALKLPYVAILLREGEHFRIAAAYGSPAAEPEALPLIYQREEIGRLVVAPRAPGEGFSDADRRLLEDLARQAEVAVHAVRLTADLQRSRERLVATREEERRRLRRDLHDGFGPTLASLALGLNVARKLMASNELQDAEEVLARLEQETEDTVTDVRRLIYGLRPPALDDLGLNAAIRQQAESQGMVSVPIEMRTDEYRENELVFQMEAPEELPPLPAAVEVAAYRIIQEALTNVARHARARTCCVRLSVDEATDALHLEVTDDGDGVPEGRRAGVGLSSMRERAVELGGLCDVEPIPTGGTRVLARLPLSAPEGYVEGAKLWGAPSASS